MPFLSALSSGNNSSSGEPVSSTVLVVEGSETYRDRIASLLHLSGYRAIVAPDRFAAVTLFSQLKPVLLVIDLRILVADAGSLLAYCRTEHPETPILLLADEVPDSPPEIEAGMVGFLLKPIDPGKFCTAVGRVIARASKRTGAAPIRSLRPQ